MDEKELAAELFANRDDEGEWGDPDPVGAPTKKPLAAMISIRLTEDELRQVQSRAKESGQSVSAYVREAALRVTSTDDLLCSSVGKLNVMIATGGTYTGRVGLPSMMSDGSRLSTVG